jgi:hypothetical protein
MFVGCNLPNNPGTPPSLDDITRLVPLVEQTSQTSTVIFLHGCSDEDRTKIREIADAIITVTNDGLTVSDLRETLTQVVEQVLTDNPLDPVLEDGVRIIFEITLFAVENQYGDKLSKALENDKVEAITLIIRAVATGVSRGAA